MSENFPFLGLRLLNPDDTDTLWEKKYTATVDDFLDRSKLTYMVGFFRIKLGNDLPILLFEKIKFFWSSGGLYLKKIL